LFLIPGKNRCFNGLSASDLNIPELIGYCRFILVAHETKRLAIVTVLHWADFNKGFTNRVYAMKNSIAFGLLAGASLTTQIAIAACSDELDMGGQSITGATMTGVEERSPVVTTNDVKALLSSGNNGFTVSDKHSGPAASWYDAMAYCASLESPERGDPNGPVYTDWRVPSTSEMFTICKHDHVNINFHTGEQKLVAINDQKNQLKTEVFTLDNVNAEYHVHGADFCHMPTKHEDVIKGERDFGLLVRDIYYTYDGFDSKFFSQENPRGNLTTNYSVASSFNPARSHILKAPLPISAEINTGHTLHVYCVR
jgi:hypothetical protein